MSGNKCLHQTTDERPKKKTPNSNRKVKCLLWLQWNRIRESWFIVKMSMRSVDARSASIRRWFWSFFLHYYKYENWSAAIYTGILLALKYTHINTVSVSQPNNQKKIEMRKWTAFLREIMCNDDVYIGKL